MANSYVSNHVHVVFSTKQRIKMIHQEIQPQLWGYMAGIARNHGIAAVAIGGTEDHAHALLDLGPIFGIAKAVQLLKANSSRWMNEQRKSRFEWQEGYFASSISRSQVRIVRQYIANQKEHHRKFGSAQEFELLLKPTPRHSRVCVSTMAYGRGWLGIAM